MKDFQYFKISVLLEECLTFNKYIYISSLCPSFYFFTKRNDRKEIKTAAHIINLSLNSGVVPTAWKSAKVTPVYKSGNSRYTDIGRWW